MGRPTVRLDVGEQSCGSGVERLRSDLYHCRLGGLKTVAVAVSLGLALVAATGASALPSRFDMGVYDPAANQAGGGRDFSTLDPRIAMEKTRASGARFVRIPINWNRVACSTKWTPCTQNHRPDDPKDPNDPAYHWFRSANRGWYDYEEEVAEAFAAGLEPVLNVFLAPAFAECNGEGRRPGTDGRLHCPDHVREDRENYKPNASDYARFMTAVSRKWPAVRYFQIWNEPNYARFLSPGGSPKTIERYRAMVNAAYEAIKAEDPDDFVIAGGTSPNPRTVGVLAFSPKGFLRRLVASRVNFDAYDTHPYTSGGPSTRPSSSGAVWISNLDDLRRILRRAKAEGKVRTAARFWASEFSWDSAPPDCRRGERVIDGQTYIVRAVRMKLLTRWISETAYRMWRQGVSVMIWAQLKDFPADLNANQGGLYFWGGNERIGRAKPAVKSFRFPFVAYRRNGGAYVWGRLPSSRSGEVVIERRVRGAWKRVARLRTFTSGGLVQKRLRFNLDGVNALRARVGQDYSAAFRLRAPRVPVGIVPFGCAPTDKR